MTHENKTTRLRQHPARSIILDRALRPHRAGAAKFDAIMRALRLIGFVLIATAILLGAAGLFWPVPKMLDLIFGAVGLFTFTVGLFGLNGD